MLPDLHHHASCYVWVMLEEEEIDCHTFRNRCLMRGVDRACWEPCPMRKRAISTLPCCTAKCNGVDAQLSWAGASAPCSTRRRARSTLLAINAQCNGVHPCLSWATASVLYPMRTCATPTILATDTQCNGIHPWSSWAAALAPCSKRMRRRSTLSIHRAKSN